MLKWKKKNAKNRVPSCNGNTQQKQHEEIADNSKIYVEHNYDDATIR